MVTLFCNAIQIIIWNSEELSQILPLLKLQSYLGEIFYALEFTVFICIKSSLYYLWGPIHLYILLYEHIVVLVNEELVILCAETVHANEFLRIRSPVFMQINQVMKKERNEENYEQY